MLTQLKVPDLYAAQTIVNRELQAVCRRYIEYTVLVYRTYYCILEFNLFQRVTLVWLWVTARESVFAIQSRFSYETAYIPPITT